MATIEEGTLFREVGHQRPSSQVAGAIGSMAIIAGVLAAVALAVRILAYPLQHDEHFYLPAGILFSVDGLYRDLGFSHLPNLPILLAAIFSLTGTDHYLLAGRLVVILAWALTAASYWLIGRRAIMPTALMIVLLLTNPVLLAETGMAVTNNFIASPVILLGFLAFVHAVERRSPGWVATSGALIALAIGFKANVVVIAPPFAFAALFLPRDLPIRQRLFQIALPMLAGACLGGAPTLYYLASDPAGFMAHAVHFHRGPQIAYWLAHPDPAGAKVMSIGQKLILAQQVWLTGATMVIPIALAVLGVAWATQAGSAMKAIRTLPWPVTLMAAIVVLTALAGFVPTPAFPQYYATPLPFMIALVGLLYAELDGHGQTSTTPTLVAGMAIALLAGGPMLAVALPKLAKPAAWGTIRAHRDAVTLATLQRQAGVRGPMATLEPLYALEGRTPVYPELAMGPFVYRAADWIPAADRRHYAYLASPNTIGATLAAHAPATILTGSEGELDRPLVAFATANGYRPMAVTFGDGERATLFTAPRRP